MPLRFPNESPAYRSARAKLLGAELSLRRKTEEVAALRRKLPLGGPVPEDYAFDEHQRARARRVRLSELFGDKQTLVLYSYMLGPKMKDPCPMCTAFIDGLNGNAHHLEQHVALAVTAKAPLRRVLAVGKARGWTRLRLLSDGKTSYRRHYHGESEDGAQLPMLNVFVKRDGQLRHFWGSELLAAETGDGLDPRHLDTLWPLWNVLDLTPDGRGETWYPALKYQPRRR